jgi:hypothetical protein
MNLKHFFSGMLRLLLVCLGFQVALGEEASPISEKEFLALHESLQPAPDEPWRTIPWKVSLLEAQKAAAEQNKPIFIWAMDGHPLGCT